MLLNSHDLIDVSAIRDSTTQWNKYCFSLLRDTEITNLGNLPNCLFFVLWETKFNYSFFPILILWLPAVQRMDYAFHQMNHYPVDSTVCFVITCPLEGIEDFNRLGKIGPHGVLVMTSYQPENNMMDH